MVQYSEQIKGGGEKNVVTIANASATGNSARAEVNLEENRAKNIGFI